MNRFKISLPVLAFGTALAFPVWAAPQNQSTTLDDISQSSLPEGGTLSSVTGNIRVGASRGPLSVRTVSGDIHIEQSAGSLDVRTVSGTLTVDHASGAAEIRSASGDVRVNHAGGAVSVRTMSGKSTLPHLEKDVTIRSISGDTTLTLDPASRMRTIDIGTVSGDMTLHLPHDFGGTFDILLKQRRSEKTLPLEQSLGLTVQTGAWEKNNDSSEEIRTITATGKIGDGRDHVIVRSVVGTLTLVQD